MYLIDHFALIRHNWSRKGENVVSTSHTSDVQYRWMIPQSFLVMESLNKSHKE